MSPSRELRIPRALWERLVGELHARTEGESHESGAFLLGHATEQGRRVTDVLYFDDLHPDVHAGGVVELPAAAFRVLWAIVRERGITYPVAIDNDFATWNRYKNRYWPALYLIDKRGIVRYLRIGEGGYPQTEQWIIKLLAERAEP